jgi:hypothetical protein
MKVEAPSKEKSKIVLTKFEYKVYKVLREDETLQKHTSKVYFCGQERTSDGKLYNVLIMDLLGPDL